MEYAHYIVFAAVVIGLMAIDLIGHKPGVAVSLKSATAWTLFYIGAALLFAGYIYDAMGPESASLFLTGWSLEKVLAFDNLVVFAAIFSYFNIKPEHQHKVLVWGIIGAVVLRFIFVAVGISAAHLIGPKVEIIFALIILYSAYAMLTADDDNNDDVMDSWVINSAFKWLPFTTIQDKGKFFSRGKFTPLFAALIAIEISDIMFAFDSVPVIIAVTKDPFLVYASIMFAVLGLRSLYFVLSALLRHLKYLEHAVIVVLVFIAGKLLASALFNAHVDPASSLAVVLALLCFGTLASLFQRTPHEQ